MPNVRYGRHAPSPARSGQPTGLSALGRKPLAAPQCVRLEAPARPTQEHRCGSRPPQRGNPRRILEPKEEMHDPSWALPACLSAPAGCARVNVPASSPPRHCDPGAMAGGAPPGPWPVAAPNAGDGGAHPRAAAGGPALPALGGVRGDPAPPAPPALKLQPQEGLHRSPSGSMQST